MGMHDRDYYHEHTKQREALEEGERWRIPPRRGVKLAQESARAWWARNGWVFFCGAVLGASLMLYAVRHGWLR